MEIVIAEVRDIENDPSKSGRVRVRIYNEQNDENSIKDDDLPWALPMQPINSAGTDKIGIAPHGMIPGSRVMVTFLPNDRLKQFPIVLGTFSRAYAPIIEGILRQPDEDTGGNAGEIAPDHPGN